MLASASRNSWKKLHFSALPSDLNLCAAYFLFHQHLGRLCLAGGSCSSPRGHCCESGHGGHQQSLSAQHWDSREGVHPLGASYGLNRSFTFPVSPWAHTDPRAVPAEAEGAVFVPFWCPWCRRAVGRALRAPSSGDRAHLPESPPLLGISLPTQLVPWLCGSMNLPGGSQHSSDNGEFLPCPLASSKRFICVITKYLLFPDKNNCSGTCFAFFSKHKGLCQDSRDQ